MGHDITRLLEDWEYQPGQVVVRKFKGKDGIAKIQLRVDLGLLQMNAEGRPDGKRPFGYPSLFEYHQARLYRHKEAHDGSETGFVLKAEDCAKLQLEVLQFHHRYICLLQLEDYAGVVRDAERNVAVLQFVSKYAGSEEWSWSLRQFQPQLLLILTRARASLAMEGKNYPAAIARVEAGIEEIREFYRETGNPEGAEHFGETASLEKWLEEIRTNRPLSRRERLERALLDAVRSEDYERAAKVRDQLRSLPAVE